MNRISRNRRMRERRAYRRFLILVCLLVMTASFWILSGFSPAGRQTASYKYYTVVYVDRGDTLSSIARRFYTREWGSISRYENEILSLNHRSVPVVYYGEQLALPYYSAVLK